MDYQDQLEKERVDVKNTVEEYVYNMRDRIESNLKEFISDDDRTKFLQLLNATEEWLYDEGEDQPKKVGMANHMSHDIHVVIPNLLLYSIYHNSRLFHKLLVHVAVKIEF